MRNQNARSSLNRAGEMAYWLIILPACKGQVWFSADTEQLKPPVTQVPRV